MYWFKRFIIPIHVSDSGLIETPVWHYRIFMLPGRRLFIRFNSSCYTQIKDNEIMLIYDGKFISMNGQSFTLTTIINGRSVRFNQGVWYMA